MVHLLQEGLDPRRVESTRCSFSPKMRTQPCLNPSKRTPVTTVFNWAFGTWHLIWWQRIVTRRIRAFVWFCKGCEIQIRRREKMSCMMQSNCGVGPMSAWLGWTSLGIKIYPEREVVSYLTLTLTLGVHTVHYLLFCAFRNYHSVVSKQTNEGSGSATYALIFNADLVESLFW